jgi:hypothetical protein
LNAQAGVAAEAAQVGVSDGAARIQFSDIQRVLALFAQGIAGSPLHLKPFERNPASGRAGRIFTDGTSIHLPDAIGHFESRTHNHGAYRVVVLHQIGYLRFGTFGFNLGEAALRMALPAARPPATGSVQRVLRLVPARHVPDLEHFFDLGARPAWLKRVFVTLEDLRIDTLLRRRYPGARADINRVLAHALAGRAAMVTRRPAAFLLEALVRYSLGEADAALLAADTTALLAPVLAHAAEVERVGAVVYDSARAALAICALLEESARRARRTRSVAEDHAEEDVQEPTGMQVEAGGSPDEQLEGLAVPAAEDIDGPGVDFRGELMPGLVHRNLGGGKVGVALEGMDADALEVEPGDEPGEAGVEGPAVGRALAARRAEACGPRSFLYDEWDYKRQTYLSAWCRLYEERLRGDDFGFIDEVRRRHAQLAKQVKRQFGRIRAEAWQRTHHASDGDELGLDAMIEAVIDRRAGHATDEHLYVRRDRARRDVAAAFLMDMSASTDFPIPDPDAMSQAEAQAAAQDPYLWGRMGATIDPQPLAKRRRVIDVAKESLALMCDALRTLGDTHAVYGFSGEGRDNVEFHVARDFGDAFSARTWAALAAMEPRRSTRMGPAIRHAAAKLGRQPEAVKVLIVVSDGYPQDSDYGPDRRDEEYGIQDTARALREAADAGISTFCVTIDPAGHDYLQRMCEADRYMVIDDVAALPGELTKIYRALTA